MSKYILRPRSVKKHRLDYLLTETGRIYVKYGVVGLAATVTLGIWMPNSLLIEKYRSILQAYRLNRPHKVPGYLKERVQAACNVLSMKDFDKKFVRSFMADGLDIKEIGSLRSRHGGWIGIPLNYEFSHPDNIDKSEIRTRQEEIDWSTPPGELLKNSLVLTEDEQIFGICRSLVELKSFKMITDIALPVVTIFSIYFTAVGVNRKFNLYAKHRGIRVALYSCVTLLGTGLYCYFADFVQRKRDEEVDSRLASLGPEWCDAGVRYYTKLLNKNKAIREINDNNDYTAEGDINYGFREKTLPFTYRKQYFETKLRESNTELESDTKSKGA